MSRSATTEDVQGGGTRAELDAMPWPELMADYIDARWLARVKG